MNWLGGLQVWSESSRRAQLLNYEPDVLGQWLWVRPKKGCASEYYLELSSFVFLQSVVFRASFTLLMAYNPGDSLTAPGKKRPDY
jgi:hypothetical protein